MRSAKINIWLIMDGKRGHEKQSEFLIQALQNLADIEITKMDGMFLKPFISTFLRLFNLHLTRTKLSRPRAAWCMAY